MEALKEFFQLCQPRFVKIKGIILVTSNLRFIEQDKNCIKVHLYEPMYTSKILELHYGSEEDAIEELMLIEKELNYIFKG